jgi:alkylation response protein AidB-like acyl-CoA dehydrogenase
MCEQLALQAVTISEELGGQGFGDVELAAVCEELGRAVYMGPLFATALATFALQACGDTEIQPRIAAGEITATLAVHEPERGWALDAPSVTAVRDGDGYRLTGTKAWVLDGTTADVLIVSAGESLVAVRRDAAGVDAVPVAVLDLTRPLATVSFDGAAASWVGSIAALPSAMLRADAALAAEQAGGAQACLEMTVEYAAERIQFGRPIGSYQAIRHRLADMFVLAETARATARHAARAVAQAPDDPETAVAIGVARSFCSEAYLTVAEQAIQLHGGIGFTWEHPAHLFFKRAKASALMFGDPAAQRARVAPALMNPTAR